MNWNRLESALMWFLTIGVFSWIVMPLIGLAATNDRIVELFYSDEAIHLRLLRDALASRTLALYFESYGHLYFNLTLLPLFVISWWVPLTDYQIMLALRLIPMGFGIATTGLTFLMTRRYFGNIAAWFAWSALLTFPLVFLARSAISNPDMPQLFFILLGLYALCRFGENAQVYWLWNVAIASGFAFATKYSGLFVLLLGLFVFGLYSLFRSHQSLLRVDPLQVTQMTRILVGVAGVFGIFSTLLVTPELGFAVQWLSIDGSFTDPINIQLLHQMQLFIGVASVMLIILSAIPITWRYTAQHRAIAQSLAVGGAYVALFVLAFSATSPFSYARLAFLKGMIRESRDKAIGIDLAVETSGLMWFEVLFSTHGLPNLILILLCLSLGRVIWKLLRQHPQALFTADSLLWMWVIFFMGYLIARVAFRPPHYLLPVIPALLILAAAPFGVLQQWLSDRFPERHVLLQAGVVALILVGHSIVMVQNNIPFRDSELRRGHNNQVLIIGEQLQKTIRLQHVFCSIIAPTCHQNLSIHRGRIKRSRWFGILNRNSSLSTHTNGACMLIYSKLIITYLVVLCLETGTHTMLH